MAGSIEVTEQRIGHGLVRYEVAWVADGSGVVSGESFYLQPGFLRMFGWAPGAGDVQPTSLYDAVLLCEHGVDTYGGAGANLANNATTHSASLSWVHGGLYTPGITNAGATNEGTLLLWVDKG